MQLSEMHKTGRVNENSFAELFLHNSNLDLRQFLFLKSQAKMSSFWAVWLDSLLQQKKLLTTQLNPKFEYTLFLPKDPKLPSHSANKMNIFQLNQRSLIGLTLLSFLNSPKKGGSDFF